MVLTRGDDYPLHQTPEPVAYAGTDRNFYDRYFFNGYAPDGSGFFALAFGVYPHLDIADAHFSVVRDGVQHCIHASRELGMERMALEVGPIRIEIVEPLSTLRVTVAEHDSVSAELLFSGRSVPIEEPRFTHRIGPRTFMDYTRMTQNGRYEGWIEVDGERRELAAGTMGTRDRSWGVRPIGARDMQPMPSTPMPSFFWQWTPINLTGGSVFFHINAEPDGSPWNTRAVWVPEGGDNTAIGEGQGKLDATLEAGSRWPSGGMLELDIPGAPNSVTLDVLSRFQMRGLGYTHPEWGHGMYHGPLKVAREDFGLAALDPLAPDNLHVQMIAKATADNGDCGIGSFEQLAIGPYAPLGLSEFLDGAA